MFLRFLILLTAVALVVGTYARPSGSAGRPQTYVVRPGEKQIVAGYRAAFPDLVVRIVDQIEEGDRVVTRWTARGTHTGDLWGIAATGREVTVTGTTTDRIRDGLIAESWSNWDTIGLMQQLGVIPAMAQA